MRWFARLLCALAILPALCGAQTQRVVTGDLPLSVIRWTPGPLATYLSTFPAFLEFQRSGWGLAKGSMGALGSPEMNLSFNMDYTTGTHRLYDTSRAAHWLALSDAGLYLQYAPATQAPGNVWDLGGNQVAFAITMDAAAFSGDVVPLKRAGADLGARDRGFARLYVDGINTDIVGDVVLNRSAGRVNVPAGATTVRVVNSHAAAGAHVFVNAAGMFASALPADGVFTVQLHAPAPVDTAVDFFIVSH